MTKGSSKCLNSMGGGQLNPPSPNTHTLFFEKRGCTCESIETNEPDLEEGTPV